MTLRDRLFGLDRAAEEDGMRLLTTVYNDAEMMIVKGILEGERISYLAKDRGSGGAVRVIAGYSALGTDILVPEAQYDEAQSVLEAYRNGTSTDCEEGDA